ncbi:helix-turn-helix domain-containing protein [Burkholderia contaminans]|uniref:IclR family transcriptional regulator C-terminal domain-containing protein n=1 Tax=Burkholderia contaminans TaxID=488447 RepID=A0AAP4VJ21_9BURK|nr:MULTISPECIES: IclR family transcriptional regulator C-terminal domain-containing protein [Burkholderia]MBD1411060.1 helix-turn-helix domain-containing protein [Burkholderia contaminans]MBH9666402.1 helix-turn-helix domain-containing protein [Burkholderia contaminans]MBH9674048.1 helix-turn-helix domain-containing protein [Burkholderia contaminans]MBH9704094.1 helix-turn-helix domain-containing protein [Burkholderia contaminans]MBH9719447.1 helix-turn-helix domain-containing protein [Burkhol
MQNHEVSADDAPPKAQRGIQSVEVGGRLLDALARRRKPLGLSELAAAADLSTAQAHTYLVSLMRLALVKRDAITGNYEPGPLSLRLGLMSIERQPAYRAALPHAARLAEAVGLSVALSVPGALGPTIVRIEHGGYPLHVNLHVGSVMSLDTTATGRVFRAFGDPAQLDAMAASQAGAGATLAGAEQPVPDAGVPQAELDAIRARGIERGVDLPSPGVSAMCVPVFDAEGKLQLALTVIGSTGSIDVDWEGPIAAALRDAARQASASLGAAHDAPPPASGPGPAPVAPRVPPGLADDAKAQRGINALDSTGELLLALVSAGRALPLRDLAAAAGMPAAKAFPHLVSLQKIGLLSRDDAGCFGGGPLGQALGLIAMQRVSPTRDAEAEIVALAGATDMSVAAATLGPLGPTVIRLEESARPQHVSLQVGTVMSLVNTAIGRIFASGMSDDVLADLLANEPVRLAGRAAAPADAAFRARLATIRADELDFAFDAPVPGIGTVAAPVFDHTGSIRLVIAIIGSSRGFPRGPDSDLAQALLAATRRLSWRFGWIGG